MFLRRDRDKQHGGKMHGVRGDEKGKLQNDKKPDKEISGAFRGACTTNKYLDLTSLNTELYKSEFL